MAMFEIRLPCRGCGKECRATITDRRDSARIRCSACGITLLEARSIVGYVYVLSHPKLRGLLKVGFSRRPIAEEVQELNWVSGLPERFVVEATFESPSPEQHVAEIHKRLAARRLQGMEYFEATLEFALRVVRAVIPSATLDEEGSPVFSPPVPDEAASGAIGKWSCGLCKHQWRAAAPDRCPLCQSAAIVLLAEHVQPPDNPTL